MLVLLGRTPQPVTGEHILASPVRRAILEAVARSPGITLGELRAGVKLGWGNAYHHLLRLERARLIRTQRVGRRLVIFPADFDARAAAVRAVLRGAASRAIADDIAAHPGTDVTDVATRTGLSRRAVYYHVQQLTTLGVVTSRSGARQFALHVTSLYDR